jgi:hypothetical protein
MRSHKTVTVESLRDMFNSRIAVCPDKDGRRELCTALETILHDSGNYRGFGYIDGWQNVEDYRRRYN